MINVNVGAYVSKDDELARFVRLENIRRYKQRLRQPISPRERDLVLKLLLEALAEGDQDDNDKPR